MHDLEAAVKQDSIKAAREPARELLQETILRITGDFSSGNLLGEGHRGLVYGGLWSDSRSVAVKVMFVHSAAQAASAERRVRLLAKLQHEHMLHVLGYCITPTRQYVVFDFGGYRTLAQLLAGAEVPPPL